MNTRRPREHFQAVATLTVKLEDCKFVSRIQAGH